MTEGCIFTLSHRSLPWILSKCKAMASFCKTKVKCYQWFTSKWSIIDFNGYLTVIGLFTRKEIVQKYNFNFNLWKQLKKKEMVTFAKS